MLDEPAARKPEFDQGNSVPIVLADGQAWWFPKPWLEFYPPPPGQDLIGAIFTLGPDFEAARRAVEAKTAGDQVVAMFALARIMLGFHYELSDADYGRLLRFRPDHGPTIAMWQAIIDVATGSSEDSPKPSGDGPGPP